MEKVLGGIPADFHLTSKMKKGLRIALIIISIFLINFISAVVIDNSLHLNIQTVNSSNDIITGTFNFDFNISTSEDCSNVIYTNSTTLVSDSRGMISYYLENVNLNFSEQYWLCYYRDGTLINASKISRSPYSFTAKNISAEGVKNDSNLTLTGNTGFFSYLGSLLSRVTKIFAVDMDLSGNLNVTGNITTSGYVGIGTSNPSYELDIEGLGNDSTIQLGKTSHNNYAGMQMITDQVSSAWIFARGSNYTGSYWALNNSLNIYNSNGPISLLTNGANNRLVISQSGNVGIGTTTPTQKLEVVGSILSNGGWLGSISIAPHIFLNQTDETNMNARIQAEGDLLKFMQVNGANSALVNLMVINISSRNVGIGTTTPSNTLDVRGTGNFSGTIYINNGTDVSTLGGGMDYTNIALTNQSNTFNGNQTINGRVGIGTASSSGRLYVNTTGNSFIESKITLSINDTTGFIGIGTDSPDTILNIGKSLGWWDGARITIGSALGQSGIAMGVDSQDYGRIYWNPTTNELIIGGVVSNQWVANTKFDTGNVNITKNLTVGDAIGIGITSWAGTYKLYVNGGGIRATGVIQSDDIIQGTAFYDSDNILYYIDPSNSGTSAVLKGKVNITDGDFYLNNSVFYINHTSGDVSIGKTTGTYPLNVYSTQNTHIDISSSASGVRVGVAMRDADKSWSIQTSGDIAGDPFVIRDTTDVRLLVNTTEVNINNHLTINKNASVNTNNRFCLDGPGCSHYIYYNGSATIIV